MTCRHLVWIPRHINSTVGTICHRTGCVTDSCDRLRYEKSGQLDVKPAEYFVVVAMREKRRAKLDTLQRD